MGKMISEMVSELERRENDLEALCGHILATLLIENNREHVHPELLRFAESWKKKYDEIVAKNI